MLSPKNILQIDATILAGILILLSLVFTNPSFLENIEKVSDEEPFIDRFSKTPVAWVYAIGIFFSFSACAALLMNYQEDKEKKMQEKNNKSDDWYRAYRFLSLSSMFVGFATFFAGFIKLGEIFF